MNGAAILAERALRLAEPLAPVPSLAEEFLLFAVGGVGYAIESASVLRIEQLGPMAPIPGLPPYVTGVVRLAGEVLPLFDLPMLLGGLPIVTGGRTYALVIGRKRAEFALAVDGSETLDARRLEAVAGDHVAVACVRGVLPNGRIVLNGAALIDDPRLTVNEPLLPSSKAPKEIA
jgi:chemotaxis signal transduction protein